MAALLAGGLSSIACCLGSTFSFCGCVMTCTKSVAARTVYFVLFFVAMIFAWIGKEVTGDLAEYVDFDEYKCDTDVCYGRMTVFRIALGSTIFHTFMAVIMYGVNSSRDPRIAFQNDFWIVKITLWIGLMIAMFFVPHDSVMDFARFSIFASVVFLIIQQILLIDMGFSFHELLMELEQRFWYIVLSFGLIGGTVALLALMFVYFSGDGCDLNNFFIAVTFISSFFMIIASLMGLKGLMPAAVIVFYCAYLCFSGMLSEPADDKCVQVSASDSWEMILLGVVITLLSLAYSTARMASSSDKMGVNAAAPASGAGESSSGGNRPLLVDAESGASSASSGDDLDDEREASKYNYTYFHFIFATASMYMGMVLTSWSLSDETDDNTAAVDSGWTSVWVKIGSQWLTILLFVWVMIRERVLPNRDFS